MGEQTIKMIESCGIVSVQGWSARSGPRRLDRGVAWTRGARSTWGARPSVPRSEHGDWSGAHGDRSGAPTGSVGDQLAGLGPLGDVCIDIYMLVSEE
jgi:hypothetical protein